MAAPTRRLRAVNPQHCDVGSVEADSGTGAGRSRPGLGSADSASSSPAGTGKAGAILREVSLHGAPVAHSTDKTLDT
eukprot:11556523-Heterocapsa_arctica.AAC.1